VNVNWKATGNDFEFLRKSFQRIEESWIVNIFERFIPSLLLLSNADRLFDCFCCCCCCCCCCCWSYLDCFNLTERGSEKRGGNSSSWALEIERETPRFDFVPFDWGVIELLLSINWTLLYVCLCLFMFVYVCLFFKLKK